MATAAERVPGPSEPGGERTAVAERTAAEAAPIGSALSSRFDADLIRSDPHRAKVFRMGPLRLQRLAGNRAIANLVQPVTARAPTVQRIPLEDGPPLAPGNYRCGPTIVSLNQAALRTMLSNMAGKDGLAKEKAWLRRSSPTCERRTESTPSRIPKPNRR